LPVIVAGGICAGSAVAIELGPLEVHSKLGHPLRASIAFVLGPNEFVDASCVSLRSGSSGLPNIFDARVSVTRNIISLSGRTPIHEPLMTANLVIDCAYTAHVSRSYTMFLDPSVEPAAVSGTVSTVASAAPEPRRAVRARPVVSASSEPIAQDSSYLVQPGDSLSGIAERLHGRTIALQAAMTAIYDSNPEAFVDNDANQLQAGSLLRIPVLADNDIAPRIAVSDVESTVMNDAAGLADDNVARDAGIYDGAESYQPADAGAAISNTPPPPVEDRVGTTFDTPAASDVDAPVEEDSSLAEVPDSVPQQADNAFADLQPGDVIVGEDLAAGGAAASDTIPDTTIAPPPRQVAGSRIIAAPQVQGGILSSWLVWLAIGVLSALGAFLAFGQKIRDRFGSTPVGAPDSATQPQSVHGTPRVAAIAVPEPTMSVEEIQPSYDAVDFDLSDDSPTEENLALDADLIEGTGLDESDDVDVNQDFGFAATTSVDMELPEPPDDLEDLPETDIIPPPERSQDDLVIDSEVLPEDEDYDMSVIVDVTKMPNPDDVTERDLMAVPVEQDNGQTPISDTYTINDEINLSDEIDFGDQVDFDPMGTEIDDDLAATQALSEEIEKAAADLADSAGSSGETSIEMQLTSLSELDLTSELEAQNDDYDDDITARIDPDDETVEMPAKDKNAG
jgi:FimV-like protein